MRIPFFLVALVFGISAGLTILTTSQSEHPVSDTPAVKASTSELIQIYDSYFQLNLTFAQVLESLTEVSDEHGAEAAFDLLIESKLPKSIDSHLMGHFVGDILYDQQGIEGLTHCTDAIGFACAHSIVINALLDKGPSVFDEINDICGRVPGGNGYGMCFHGFGHGVLAFTEYHLPEAIKACVQVGTEAYGYEEAEECVGGVIMEMRGGIHNPRVWEQNGAQYLDKENPLYMCQADYMPDAYREYCYIYITPFIFDTITKADIPTYKDFAPATNHCANASLEFQEACYGGFAKEYLGFILGRDIRLVQTINTDQLTDLWQACEAAATPLARSHCAKYAVYNLYRSGSHPYEISADFCSLVSEDLSKNACFTNLQDQVFSHNESADYRTNFCTALQNNYGVECQSE